MAKRFHKPFGNTDSKKPRLDVTISQQFLPLSQNIKPSSTNGTINDSKAMWGDDNDDEMLLQVSQACEEVNDVNDMDTSALPDYSFCMKPRMTSTQVSTLDGYLNTGKLKYLQWGDTVAQQSLIRIPVDRHNDNNNSIFKKPAVIAIPNKFPKLNGASNHQLPSANKFCLSLNRSPQQTEPEVTTKGILEATKQQLDEEKEILEELGLGSVYINDNNQCILKQLVQLRKENDKFKMEQNKLLDRCVTKEGEVSILRSQLKSMGAAAESARLQRIQAHEQQQRQWTDRLNAAQTETKGLQAELEFKNMEISKVKDKCKHLETSKLKPSPRELPRVAEKRGFCQRLNESFSTGEKQQRKVFSSAEAVVQTDETVRADSLHIPMKETFSLKQAIKETIFDTSKPENKPFISCAGDTFGSDYKGCSLFKRKLLNIVPSVKRICQQNSSYSKLESLYRDLAHLMKQPDQAFCSDECKKMSLKIGLIGKEMLAQAREQLEALSNKINLSILKKMDELYLQYTSPKATLNMDFDFFSARGINDKEQCIELRRILMIIAVLCPYSSCLSEYILGLRRVPLSIKSDTPERELNDNYDSDGYLPVFLDLCRHIGNLGCANVYSGVLSAICGVICGSTVNIELNEDLIKSIFSVLKELVFSRPPAVTIRHLLIPISKLSTSQMLLSAMCHDNVESLKIDQSQGIATYTKDICFIHILSSQVKVCLKQLEFSQQYVDEVFEICWNLLTLGYNSSLQKVAWSYGVQDMKCLCPVKFVQSIVLALKLCIKHYKDKKMWIHDITRASKFRTLLSEGLMMLYLWSLRDVEFLIKIGEYEGHYQMFVETCKELESTLLLDEIHAEALADLSGSLDHQSDNEELHSVGLNVWEQSLDHFYIID